jgi:hypothetical protein
MEHVGRSKLYVQSMHDICQCSSTRTNGHNFKDYKMVFPHKLVATQGTPWRVEKMAVRGQNDVVSRGGDSEKL